MTFRPILALVLLAPLAAADTLHVPADFATPQAAVDAAADGDTIVVSHGTYTDPVVIDGRHDLVLRGAGHPLFDVTGDFGVTVSASTNVTVSGLVVHGALKAGIMVQDSTDVLVQKCKLSGSGWGQSEAGLRVAGGSQVVLDHNRVENAVLIGIWIWNDGDPDATDCTLTHNVVDTVWHACIEVHGSGHLVDRNTLLNAVDEGIFVDADTTTLSQNVVRQCNAGITVFGGNNAVLDRNLVKDAGSWSVHVAVGATGTSLTQNRMVHAGLIGLFVEASGGSYDGDRVTLSDGAGAEFDGLQNVVLGLRVGKTGGTGVLVGGGSNQFTDVRVTAAGTDGLSFTSDQNTVQSCRAMHCGVSGFAVAGNDNSFTGCTALKNGVYDLAYSGTGNVFDGCSFKTTYG